MNVRSQRDLQLPLHRRPFSTEHPRQPRELPTGSGGLGVRSALVGARRSCDSNLLGNASRDSGIGATRPRSLVNLARAATERWRQEVSDEADQQRDVHDSLKSLLQGSAPPDRNDRTNSSGRPEHSRRKWFCPCRWIISRMRDFGDTQWHTCGTQALAVSPKVRVYMVRDPCASCI